MNERILIFGNGQLGNFYDRYFTAQKISSKIAKADITKPNEIEEAIASFNPTVVINTAAKTNLEWCSENKLEAFHVNVLGADNIAKACDKKGIYFIHFSSGCIFESKNAEDAKKEEDVPQPAAYYSLTKVWAEQMIQFEKSKDFKYLILRPRQPVSAQVNYKNMLVKMLMFSKFIDTPNTGTVIEDLMDWTKIIIEKRPVGILHVANEGWVTPYEIGMMIKEHILPNLEPEKISKEELDRITPNRRVDTVLVVDKLKSIVGEVKSYRERLEDLIVELAQNLKDADAQELAIQLGKTFEQMKQRSIPNDVWSQLLASEE